MESRTSEKRLHQLGAHVATSHVPVMIVDLIKQRVIDINDGFTKEYGWKRNEVAHKTLRELIGDEGVTRLRDALENAADETNRSAIVHENIKCKNDITVPVSIYASVTGGVAHSYVACTLIECSAASVAEHSTNVREERSELVSTVCGHGVWDHNLVTSDAYYSTAWAEMRGYSLNEIEPTIDTWSSCIHPDDMLSVQDAREKHLAGKTPLFVAEFRVSTKSNEWRWVLCRGKVIDRDSNGKALRMVGTHVDITPRKEAEIALTRSRNVLTTVLEELPVGIVIADAAEKKITVFNSAAADVCTLSEEKRKEIQDIKLNEQQAWHITTEEGTRLTPLQDALNGDISETKEVVVNPAGSHMKKVLLSAAPIHDTQGKVYAAIMVLVDVTDLRQMEESHSRLEDKLRQMQKLQALGVLAGGIAHDFNNILCSMMGFCELGLEDINDEVNVENCLHEVLIGGKRAEKLVHQILAFSRPGEGKMVPMQLESLIRETIELLRSSFPTTISIDFYTDSSDAVIHADATQVHELVMNLATNAYQALPEHVGKVEITLAKSQEQKTRSLTIGDITPGAYHVLCIQDNGEGMTEDVLEHIFEPYFSTREPGSGTGTGCGLATVSTIVQAHNGAIDVESAPGNGTKVRVFFPVISDEDKGDLTEYTGSEAKEGNGHVIILDDDEHIVLLNMLSLEGLGYTVHPCRTVRQALDVLNEKKDIIDAVITDQTMPEMTGVELAHKIRELNDKIAVIVCSGYTDIEEKAADRRNGVDAFLTKPISRSVLSRTLNRVLAEKEEK